MAYRIGALELENRYFLAPMAGINDIAFRILCKKAGAGLCYTGMINPLSQEKLDLDDKPAIQLFATNEEGISDFIEKHDSSCSLFDFNLGCPAKTARRHGFGYFLNDLKIIERILKSMKEATDKPITLKIRKSANAGKILKLAEKYCDAICIHPRTQPQGYSGVPDLKFALKLKKKTKLPMGYSGNLNENNAYSLLEKFDFVMLARSAAGNPNIFAKLIGSPVRFGFLDYLKLARKYHLPFSQIKLQAMNFTKGKDNAREIRRKLIKAKSHREILEIYNL